MRLVAARKRGLSTSELGQVRESLAAGRKPKVMFTETAGQLAGQQGQVIQLADPAASDEWVIVRFGRDTLPFAPTDLAMAPKAAPARRASARPAQVAAAVGTPAAAVAVAPVPRQPVGEPARATASPAKAAVEPPAKAAVEPPAKAAVEPPAKAAAEPPVKPAVPPVKPAASPAPAAVEAVKPAAGSPAKAAVQPVAGLPVAGDGAAGARKPAAARRVAKGRSPAALTVTLSYADGDWTVAAHQGARVLARPTAIRPGEALRMVGLLDVPGVAEAVEEIVTTARAEAEQAAERLRAELAEIEARLAELPGAS
jgi:hypothetical protein